MLCLALLNLATTALPVLAEKSGYDQSKHKGLIFCLFRGLFFKNGRLLRLFDSNFG